MVAQQREEKKGDDQKFCGTRKRNSFASNELLTAMENGKKVIYCLPQTKPIFHQEFL